MIIRRIDIPFENQMSRTQTVLGWIYFVVHMALLPRLLWLYADVSPKPMTEPQVNLIWLVIGMVFVLCVMYTYLRRCFDILLDRLRLCLLAIPIAFLISYALRNFLSLIILLIGDLGENPNDAAIIADTADNAGLERAMGIFLAPIVEEVLCRGVIFGSIRTRSRGWAYVVSVALFALGHVWQYALAFRSPVLLLYAIQYVPMAVAFAWAYERTGSIWTPIFVHMCNNALWHMLNT